jgi:hypothetical protein
MARPGDWMVKLDLRHAYLVVPIHPRARPAFRFRAAGPRRVREQGSNESAVLALSPAGGRERRQQPRRRRHGRPTTPAHSDVHQADRQDDTLVTAHTFEDLGRKIQIIVEDCAAVGNSVAAACGAEQPRQGSTGAVAVHGDA